MRVVAPAVLLFALLGVAALAGATGPGATEPQGAPNAVHEEALSTSPPLGDKDRLLVFAPGGSYGMDIVATGGYLLIAVRLNDGASLGGILHAPKGCLDDAFSTNVIGLSTQGQVVAWTECQVPAGPLAFTVDAGQSAFVGTVELVGATFAPA